MAQVGLDVSRVVDDPQVVKSDDTPKQTVLEASLTKRGDPSEVYEAMIGDRKYILTVWVKDSAGPKRMLLTQTEWKSRLEDIKEIYQKQLLTTPGFSNLSDHSFSVNPGLNKVYYASANNSDKIAFDIITKIDINFNLWKKAIEPEDENSKVEALEMEFDAQGTVGNGSSKEADDESVENDRATAAQQTNTRAHSSTDGIPDTNLDIGQDQPRNAENEFDQLAATNTDGESDTEISEIDDLSSFGRDDASDIHSIDLEIVDVNDMNLNEGHSQPRGADLAF